MEDQNAFTVWYENEVRSGRDPSQFKGCPINIPPPVYPFSTFPSFCGCSMVQQKEHKKDCYFFHEDHDMGATIPFCSYHKGALGDCPCKDCENYLSNSDAHKIIMDAIKERKL